MRFSVVCLSSQDWDAPLPTNRQQIMRSAARAGHEVLFVETGGWLGRHVKRAFAGPGRRRALARILATEPVEERVRRRKALNLLPWGQRFAFARAVNSRCTALAVRLAARSLPLPHVLWVYDPCAAPAGSDMPTVYDCVDDYAEQVGADPRRRAIVDSADERVARNARIVFTTARPLHARQLGRNRRTHLVPNAADYEHFARAARTIAAPETAALPRPVLGFAGNLTAAKVDFGLLAEIAAARPGWTILLVGPTAADADGPADALLQHANVVWVGGRPYAELPRYVAAFDVGLIPYRSTRYTSSCFPLKLFEYLAAGKPVVASGLPELAGMEPDVVLASGTTGFLAAVSAALELCAPGDVRRRASLAAAHTWDARAARLLELVAEGLS